MIRSWQPREPKTLQQAILFFSHYANCHRAVDRNPLARWRRELPALADPRTSPTWRTQRRWKCYEKHPRAQFSLKVGTIFEDSAIGLEKWLPALWLRHQLQERHQQLRTGPRARRHPKDRMVHAVASASRPSGRALAARLAATSKPTKPSSAAKRATCTRPSASASASRRAVR